MPTKDELEADLAEALHKLDLAEKREARAKDKVADLKEEVAAPEASLDAIEAMADELSKDASNGVLPHLMAVKGAVHGARDAQSAEASQLARL